MSLNLKRPKRINEEDEDDLLRFQEEFLKNKSNQQPAAKVIRKTNADDSKKLGDNLIEPTNDENNLIHSKRIEIDFQEDSKALESVLTEIVEKPFNKDWKQSSLNQEINGIPKVEKLNIGEISANLTTEKRKNKSLFAQNLELKGKLKSHYPLDQVYIPNKILENDEKIKLIEKSINVNNVKEPSSLPKKQLITGDGLGNSKDVQQIHLENLEILSKMSPEEILAEQKKLIQQMDPKLVAFIRKKANNFGSDTNNEKDLVESSSKDKENIITDEIFEPLGMKPNKTWLHMDKIEFDKLEWMLKPKISVDAKSTSAAARFDFAGELLDPNADVSIRQGLHHHGNDPDSPGYTLDELFLLARSKFTQQRVIALQTLANILTKCHQGYYNEIIKADSKSDGVDPETLDDENNLLNQLIDGGLLFLLRWNLDDQTESIINVCLEALKNLLQSNYQETYLDRSFDWDRGSQMSSLHPFSSFFSDVNSIRFKVDKNLNLSEKRELNELKDDEYIKQDLVGGLMRMNLIERFQYLIEKYNPQLSYQQITNNMFLILFRLLRHSAEFCYEFTQKYRKFLDLLASRFLPLYIQDNHELNNVAHMLKLIRLLSSCGPTIAYKLYVSYNLKEKLTNYLACEKYIKEEFLVTQLQIESSRLLKTFVSYAKPELGIDCLYDCFEMLLVRLNTYLNEWNSIGNQLSIALISLFRLFLLTPESENIVTKSEICSSVYSVLCTVSINRFKTIQDAKEIKSFEFISHCLNYLVDYLEKCELWQIDRYTKIEQLIEYFIVPFVTGNDGLLSFDNLIFSKLQVSSIYSDQMKEKFKKINSNNLSYLPTAQNVNNDPNEIFENVVFRFLASYVRFYYLAFKLKMNSIDDKAFTNVRRFLNNEYIKSYFRVYIKNNSQSKQSVNNEFLLARNENLFIYYCLKLMVHIYNLEDTDLYKNLNLKNDENYESKIKKRNDEKKLFYLLAMSLLLKLKQGDEYILYDVVASFLFNMNFWSSYLQNDKDSSQCNSLPNCLVKYFEKMKLSDSQNANTISMNQDEPHLEISYLNINFGQSETIRINQNSLKTIESVHIYETLNQIKFNYLENEYLFKNQSLEHSRQINFVNYGTNGNKQQLKSLFLSSRNTNTFLVEPDWMYFPIMKEVESNETRKKQLGKELESSSKLISILSNCLKYIYLLEVYYGVDYMDSNLSMMRRYIRLLYVYLLDSEVFLDKQIITYMYLIYFKYAKLSPNQPLSKLDFNEKIDVILSFEDFYKNLLNNYDSTSFGDYVFSLFVVVPLQQVYSFKYRQLFWSEFSHLFKYIRFDKNSKQLLLDLKCFTQPNEKNLHMIRLYTQLLLDPTDFQHIFNSKIGYTIIVASLNSFIFEQINQVEKKVELEFKKLLVKQFLSLNNQKVKNDIINFKCLSDSSENIILYDELPEIRKQWLNKLTI